MNDQSTHGNLKVPESDFLRSLVDGKDISLQSAFEVLNFFKGNRRKAEIVILTCDATKIEPCVILTLLMRLKD